MYSPYTSSYGSDVPSILRRPSFDASPNRSSRSSRSPRRVSFADDPRPRHRHTPLAHPPRSYSFNSESSSYSNLSQLNPRRTTSYRHHRTTQRDIEEEFRKADRKREMRLRERERRDAAYRREEERRDEERRRRRDRRRREGRDDRKRTSHRSSRRDDDDRRRRRDLELTHPEATRRSYMSGERRRRRTY